METLFAHTYLLLFGKLAVGGLLALAVPPFAEMERGFYKSSGAVYLACALLMTGGDATLWLRAESSSVTTPALAAWGLFCLVFTAYYVALFVELPRLRARAFPSALAVGLAALTLTAWAYVPANAWGPAGLVYAASTVTGAVAAGAAATGMLLGHWYLIDTGLELGPLHAMTRFYAVALRVEIATVCLGAALLWLWPGDIWSEPLRLALDSRYAWLVAGRAACWGLGLLLALLIRRTLAIPQTMAATGLFYIAALVVAVGEILSHWLLFRVGVPL